MSITRNMCMNEYSQIVSMFVMHFISLQNNRTLEENFTCTEKVPCN